MCKRCDTNREPEEELFTLEGDWGNYTWNVACTHKYIGKSELHEIPSIHLPKLISWHRIDPQHLEHVDTSMPGILVRVGTRLALIDGAHRAQRCLDKGIPFHAYILSYKQAEDCLVNSPVAFRIGKVA
jgi:hypothetical protein